MTIEKNPRTDVDVQMLWTVFPDILPDGREITHEQLEAVLHESRVTSRYRRVTEKWRKRLLVERSVWLDGMCAGGRGFIALTPDEMVRFSNRGVRAAGRKIRRMLHIAAVPADVALSEDVRRYRALLMVAMEKIAQEHQGTLRAVSKALAPQKPLPRAAGHGGA